jgi:hypothetical protein
VAEKLIEVNTFNGILQGSIAFAEKNLKSEKVDKFIHTLEQFLEEMC